MCVCVEAVLLRYCAAVLLFRSRLDCFDIAVFLPLLPSSGRNHGLPCVPEVELPPRNCLGCVFCLVVGRLPPLFLHPKLLRCDNDSIFKIRGLCDGPLLAGAHGSTSSVVEWRLVGCGSIVVFLPCGAVTRKN